MEGEGNSDDLFEDVCMRGGPKDPALAPRPSMIYCASYLKILYPQWHGRTEEGMSQYPMLIQRHEENTSHVKVSQSIILINDMQRAH
jgi:hypothetical protein